MTRGWPDSPSTIRRVSFTRLRPASAAGAVTSASVRGVATRTRRSTSLPGSSPTAAYGFVASIQSAGALPAGGTYTIAWSKPSNVGSFGSMSRPDTRSSPTCAGTPAARSSATRNAALSLQSP